MFRAYLIFVYCIFFNTCLEAQQGCSHSLRGIVQSDSGETLPGATVLLKEKNIGLVTDENGKFRFDQLCEGSHTIEAQFVGYQTQRVVVMVKGNEQITLRLPVEITELHEIVVQEESAPVEQSQNFVKLSQKQLTETAGKSLGESLREVPGVNSIQAGPGIFKPVIHGVHSQRVLILNYGIRQEGQQWGAEHAPEIDPFVASEVVVVKDASAIKYGTDALGGVIIVNPPPLPEKAQLGGSFNSVLQSNGRSGTFSGQVEGGIKNHNGWGWRVQGTAKQAGDFHTPRYSLTNTGVKELNFSAATGYHSKKYGTEIFFSHFQTQLGILKGTAISNFDDLITAIEREPPQYTKNFSYSIGEPRQEVHHNLLKWTGHRQTEKGEWTLQYGFQNNNRKEFDIRKGDLSTIPAINLQLNTHTLDLEWETFRNDKESICVGLSGMFQDNRNIPGTKRIPFIPNFVNLSGGIFAVTKLFFNHWTLDLGTRYDYRYYSVSGYDFKNTLYKTKLNFKNASATAGASIQLDTKNMVSINMSSAWRPPHVAELYSLGTHQSAAAIEYGLLLNDKTNEVMSIKDVPFKIENALKWVSTFRHQAEKFQWEITGYSNYIFNYIYLKPLGVTQDGRGLYPYFRYTQTDALFLGVDFSAGYLVTRKIKATPKVSLLRASDARNNDFLVFIPSNRYELAFRYENPLQQRTIFIESKFKYIAQQNRSPRVITPSEIKQAYDQGIDLFAGKNADFLAAPPGYFLWNLSAGYSMTTRAGKYDFRLSCENTLNRSYREYTNRFRYYADELGRNFIFSVKYSF